MKAKVDRTIALLGQYGYKLQMPYSKKIAGTKNLYELRIQQSSNICRLFYFYYKDKIYVIISGYIKKKQKTHKEEIKKALQIMKNFGGLNDEI